MAEHFLPRLTHLGLTFVFGATDFPAGPMAASIAGAVTNTSKTLVVLSKDIFQDYERELEVNLAIMHELHTRRSVLVPVLLLDRDNQLDRELQVIRGYGVQVDEELIDQGYGEEEDDDLHEFGYYNILEERVAQQAFELFDRFPAEISIFLQGQLGRCLVYDGGSEEFWMSLKASLCAEE